MQSAWTTQGWKSPGTWTTLLLFLCSTTKPLPTSRMCLWGGNKVLQHFTSNSGYWQTFFDWCNLHLFFLPGVHLKICCLFFLEVPQGWVQNIDDAAKPAFVLLYYDFCFWAKLVASMDEMVEVFIFGGEGVLQDDLKCPVASNQSSAYQDTSITRRNGFCPSGFMEVYM